MGQTCPCMNSVAAIYVTYMGTYYYHHHIHISSGSMDNLTDIHIYISYVIKFSYFSF